MVEGCLPGDNWLFKFSVPSGSSVSAPDVLQQRLFLRSYPTPDDRSHHFEF